MAKKARKRYASTDDLIEDLQAVAEGRPPLQARKLIDLTTFDSMDQDSISVLPEEEHQSETPLITMPLFWFAVVGWFLAALLFIVVIMLSR
jgi:hypothetical protein